MGLHEFVDGDDRVVEQLAADLVLAGLDRLHDTVDDAAAVEPVVDAPAQDRLGHAGAIDDHRGRRATVADEAEPAAGAGLARVVGAVEHHGHDELAVDGVVMVGRDVPVEFVGGDEHQHVGGFLLETCRRGGAIRPMAPWCARGVTRFRDPTLAYGVAMRVIVIGAGIAGASTAFHLADAGVEVVLIDGGNPGAATLAGAGIICPWPTARADDDYVDLYVTCGEGVGPIVERLAERGEPDTSYRRVGAIFLGHDDGELDEVEARVRRRAGDGGAVGALERLDGAEARRLFPPLRDDLPALFIGGGARLDGRAFTAALIRAAGADLRRGDAELVVDGGRCRGATVGGERVDADAVVVAGGAWTNRVLEPIGRAVDVEPQKGQILHLRPPDLARPTADWPVVLPPGPHYLLAFDDDRVVVGATRETGSGFDTRVTVAGQREVLDAAVTWAPGLADAEVIETRVGLRPLAADGPPTIGPVDGVDALFVGTGMGAGGLTIGPHAGRMLADAVLGAASTP